MRKRIIGALAVAIWACLASSLWAETTFRVVYMLKENPPRIMGESPAINWEHPGITPELLKMVEKKTGVKFTFKRFPWKRCLYMVEHGLADATFHASYQPERAKYGVYPSKEGKLDLSRSIYTNAYVLYARKETEVLWDGKAILNAPRPIGTQLSYAIATDLRRMGYTVEEDVSVEINLNKLAAGRISAYAEMESIADNTLRKHMNKYETIEKLSPPFKVKNYYLLIGKTFSSKHPELTKRIWDAVRDIQKTSAYKEMLKKYMK